MPADTTEKGLESLIMRHMTGTDGLASGAAGVMAEAAATKGGSGWLAGSSAAYDREFAVDAEQLFSFLMATQPDEWAELGIANYKDKEGMARQKFLARLQGEITRRGVIDVLRSGIKHGALSFDLFYGKPSAENAKAVERHAKNRFSITRQLHFSRENKRSLDLCAFINGLPVITFELKNSLTKQTVEDRIQDDPYRFLICADKFQTGYDEPLLHTMYVDKALSGIKAVQTLSRLNRAHPKKHDVFVLDFQNDTETIEEAFADYYRTTILSKETDPNKLHTLKGELDKYQVYSPEQIDALVELYLGGADRDKLDPILDACVAVYKSDLDEDGQVEFKGKAKAFTRTYDFLATILPYGVQEWEKLSIFLNFLISKLPAPIEEDLAKGILEAIDMDSYRAEKKAMVAIALPDADAEIEPWSMSGGGSKPEPEMDKLSNIVKAFNDQFGGLFADSKRMEQRITGEIPQKVAADEKYQNAKKNSDRQNAKIEHDKALKRVITALFKDDAQLFKQFQDNESFKGWLTDTVFGMTYEQ